LILLIHVTDTQREEIIYCFPYRLIFASDDFTTPISVSCREPGLSSYHLLSSPLLQAKNLYSDCKPQRFMEHYLYLLSNFRTQSSLFSSRHEIKPRRAIPHLNFSNALNSILQPRQLKMQFSFFTVLFQKTSAERKVRYEWPRHFRLLQ